VIIANRVKSVKEMRDLGKMFIMSRNLFLKFLLVKLNYIIMSMQFLFRKLSTYLAVLGFNFRLTTYIILVLDLKMQ